MIKATIGVIAGFLIWFVAATLGNLLVRVLVANYAAAEAAMAFTPPMLVARLAVAFFSSLVAGFACSYLTRGAHRATYALSLIMLIFFLPVHYKLLAQFPIWYHVVFLCTLAPLIIIGGALHGRSQMKVIDAR